MKLESHFFNPLTFSTEDHTELESSNYLSKTCQKTYFKNTDIVKFRIDFEVSPQSDVRVRSRYRGSTSWTMMMNIFITNAARQVEFFSNAYFERHFNKGFFIFKIPAGTIEQFMISIAKGGKSEVELYSELIHPFPTSMNLATIQYQDSRRFPQDSELYTYNFDGRFLNTDFHNESTVFTTADGQRYLVDSKTTEIYTLNIGGFNSIDLATERKLRAIFDCDIKIINGTEFEFFDKVDVETGKFFMNPKREVNLKLVKKHYSDKYSINKFIQGEGQNSRVINKKYTDKDYYFEIIPNELLLVEVLGDATTSQSLIADSSLVKIDLGVNTSREDKEVSVLIKTKEGEVVDTIDILQKSIDLDIDDQVLGRNYFLREL